MPENETNTSSATLTDREALAALQQQSIDLLTVNFDQFLQDLAELLFERSQRAKPDASGCNVYYDAMNAVKQNQQAIANALMVELGRHFDDLTLDEKDPYSESQQARSAHELGLISIEEFEGHLATNKMIERGSGAYRIALECLTIRIAKLAKLDPNTVYLPFSIERIARGFPRALKGKKIPREVIVEILHFFGTEFIDNLGTYYESLNLPLRETGVLPSLEQEVKASGTLLKRRKKGPDRPNPRKSRPEDLSGEGTQAGTDSDSRASEGKAGGSEASANDHFSPDALYRSVITALNFKREADALVSGIPLSDDPPQENLADSPSVADALGALQQSSDARTAVQQSTSLREYLTVNQESIGGLSGTGGLSQESINQLDLVDNLFGAIKSQVDVTTELKPALGDLQIPLAKLALLEPRFFVDRAHSARGVVDKLAELAASANFPNKALESRIGKIVDRIITEYDDDSIVFDTALEKVDKLVKQQQRAQARNRERVVKTQEGKQKLQKAQRATSEVIDAKLGAQQTPEVLVQLVNSGLRDLLILTYIREGMASSVWKEHVKTFDLLSLWLGEQLDDAIDEDMLMERSLEAEPLIDMISQQLSIALPTSVAHEAALNDLREIFSGQQAIKMIPGIPVEDTRDAETGDRHAKIKSLPRINRWVKRVNQLEKGTWLNYKDKEGQKRRMQLAWISEDKDRYIFVNELGQRHAELSPVQLARQLSRGVKPPTTADKLSLVDQSMYDTLEHVQKSLSFARNHDSLTKMINIETFVKQIGRALQHAERKHTQHALLCLNIDQFDLVNQIYDEVNGDLVLLEFAKLLAQLHDKKSSSARIKGDEFGVLLLDRNIEQAVQQANQIRADIESSSIEIEDQKVTFTVSIGVAPVRYYSPSVEELMKSANSAMHLAKDRGRNQVVEFEEDQSAIEGFRKYQLEAKSKIQTTLDTNRFVLRAQPIVQTTVDGSDDKSQHYELLLGLSNKDGTLSSPLEFIKSAERYGYMGLVDRWVVKEAFSWINQLMDSQKIVPNLSINLSGGSITDDSFMDYLLEQISDFGVGTNKLCFEITETGTISNMVKAADFVRAFRNIGCKFSIDDFGTGLASHNYLRELPVDYVKIDGTFIKEIDTNRNDYAMTRSINDLAHFLGQKTIAESVENKDVIEILTEIGVDYLQGWGVGEPKLLSDITAGLANIEK
jgi:diguanylate cyclase (GGDEF)-like protein